MGPRYYKSRSRLGDLLDEYSSEGISILTAEPSAMIRSLILIICALCLVAFAWSFIGTADVMVRAQGRVVPEGEHYRVQSPLKGKLVDVYVSEGTPVSRGDVLARVNSPNAIQMVGQAEAERLQYQAARRKYDEFPAQKKIAELRIAALKQKLDADVALHDREVAEAIAQLGEEQALKLKKKRLNLAKAREARDHAQSVYESHQRLFNSPGGGGISGQQVATKRKEFNEKQQDYLLAEAELGEFEVTLNREFTKKNAELERKSQALLNTRGQYQNAVMELVEEEQKIESDMRTTRARHRASAQMTYDDLDENNYLTLRAPVDGLVTRLLQRQPGVNIEDKSPLMLIAPQNSRKILEVRIAEQDRAFLEVGMSVKIKLNAFSYQRYGFLEGELEYISPITSPDPATKRDVYTGKVSLQRDHYLINEVRTPIRYGMGATAEILVRKRRLIDLALDPMRGTTG